MLPSGRRRAARGPTEYRPEDHSYVVNVPAGPVANPEYRKHHWYVRQGGRSIREQAAIETFLTAGVQDDGMRLKVFLFSPPVGSGTRPPGAARRQRHRCRLRPGHLVGEEPALLESGGADRSPM